MTVIRWEQERLRARPARAVPVSARLRAEWEALRVGKALPRRDRFEPRILAPLLGSLFLIDWTEQGAARFRIAGQGIARLYGMELHGAPVALLFEPAERAEIGRILRMVRDEPVAVDLGLWSEEGAAGRGPVSGRMMVLPILDRTGRDRLAIGTLEVAGVAGRPPRRFRVERCLRSLLDVE